MTRPLFAPGRRVWPIKWPPGIKPSAIEEWPRISTRFESQAVARTGVVSMPAPGETVVGNHTVLAVGYDDARQWFIARNSYGAGWGMSGYFTLPYAYLTQESL